MTTEAATLYTLAWLTYALLAMVSIVTWRRDIALFRGDYWRLMGRSWAILTFLLALVAFIVLAPYSGDPTWDWIDASFMSILTYATAPWGVGVIVRIARRKAPKRLFLPASGLWLLSASWLYDGYVWWRQGFYPATWWSNLIASSVLYCGGGLFWNLVRRDTGGITFAFLEEEWFARRDDRVSLAMGVGIVVGVVLVVGLMSPFLLEAWGRF